MTESDNQLCETLAEYAHGAWSGWMRYMFSKGYPGMGYSWVIPSALKARWHRQMNTPYADLPEDEKESDRQEADKILAIVERHATVSITLRKGN